MKDRLIKWLGGKTKYEYELLSMDMVRNRELLALANATIDAQRVFCTVTPGCVMEEGHLGGCRDISGLCFSTLHQHELARKRQERKVVSQPPPEAQDATGEAAELQETVSEA